MSEDPAERTRMYLMKIQEYLQQSEASQNEGLQRLREYARRYVIDAEYFLKAGKPTTALASVAYAEGLLDSLRILGLLEKKRPS